MLDIKTRNSKGQPIKAKVVVDGKELGVTPGVFSVWTCSRVLYLQNDSSGEYTIRVSLKKNKIKDINVVINNPLAEG
jgi:hypothetical protein